jgi:hypothetical protein
MYGFAFASLAFLADKPSASLLGYRRAHRAYYLDNNNVIARIHPHRAYVLVMRSNHFVFAIYFGEYVLRPACVSYGN